MEHICILCDKTIKNGKIPAQALANNMNLTTVGAELSELNKLERHLVSPVIPFMKIVNLPKHTQKKTLAGRADAGLPHQPASNPRALALPLPAEHRYHLGH